MLTAASSGLSLGTVESLLLGAVLAVGGGLVTELWKQRRSTRAAARLVYQELLLNYQRILSVRMGDLPYEDLASGLQLRAWETHSDVLALLGGYAEFVKAWGATQAIVALGSPSSPSPTRAAIDAVLDTIEDLIRRVAQMAGAGDTALADAPKMRMLADLPRSQRILVWRQFELEGRPSPNPENWLRARVSSVAAEQHEGRYAHTLAQHTPDQRNNAWTPSDQAMTDALGFDASGAVAVHLGDPLVWTVSGGLIAMTESVPQDATANVIDEERGWVIEIAAGDERGWAYAFEEGVILPRRLEQAGGGKLERLRAFGESKWFYVTDSAAKPERRSLSSVPGRFTRLRRKTSHGDRPTAPVASVSSVPPEPGPFTLWARVLSGELSLNAAEHAAGQLNAGTEVSDTVINEAAVMAKTLAVRNRAARGALLSRLAYAAACSPAANISELTRAHAACDLLETARMSLIDTPDPQMLSVARTAGEVALEWGRDNQKPMIVAMATFRLGTLHLDPYQHEPETYWQDHEAWLRRGMAAVGIQTLSGSEDDLRAFMPMPVPAMRIAESYLRQAVEARTGEDRGFALKALVSALVFLRELGESIGDRDLANSAVQAALLMPAKALDAQRFVRQFIPKDAQSLPPFIDDLEAKPAGPINRTQ